MRGQVWRRGTAMAVATGVASGRAPLVLVYGRVSIVTGHLAVILVGTVVRVRMVVLVDSNSVPRLGNVWLRRRRPWMVASL